jgi:hypothetical protein
MGEIFVAVQLIRRRFSKELLVIVFLGNILSPCSSPLTFEQRETARHVEDLLVSNVFFLNQ